MHRLTVELSCLHQNSYYLEAELSYHLLPHDRVDHADHFSVISGKNHITRVVNFMHPRVQLIIIIIIIVIKLLVLKIALKQKYGSTPAGGTRAKLCTRYLTIDIISPPSN